LLVHGHFWKAVEDGATRRILTPQFKTNVPRKRRNPTPATASPDRRKARASLDIRAIPRFNANPHRGVVPVVNATRESRRDELLGLLGPRPIVLVGMMGAGKTTVGRRLAARLSRHFIDSDEEVEKAANMTIPDIFAAHGEADFRAGEARVIARLLRDENIVLGTGGGAFINRETRALIKTGSLSVWIKAEADLLFARVSRRSNRPLLKTANPRQTLEALIAARYPIYAEADVTVSSADVPQDQVAGDIIEAIVAYLQHTPAVATVAHGG
jgi:shikimate kinase